MKIKMLFLALIFLNLSEFSLPENCSIVNNSEIIAGTDILDFPGSIENAGDDFVHLLLLFHISPNSDEEKVIRRLKRHLGRFLFSIFVESTGTPINFIFVTDEKSKDIMNKIVNESIGRVLHNKLFYKDRKFINKNWRFPRFKMQYVSIEFFQQKYRKILDLYSKILCPQENVEVLDIDEAVTLFGNITGFKALGHVHQDINWYHFVFYLDQSMDNFYIQFLIMHEFPKFIKKIIRLDIDMRLRVDIGLLHDQFNQMNRQEIFGLAKDRSEAHGIRSLKYLAKVSSSSFGQTGPYQALNGGLLLLDIEKLRAQPEIIAPEYFNKMKQEFGYIPMTDQGGYHLMRYKHPEKPVFWIIEEQNLEYHTCLSKPYIEHYAGESLYAEEFPFLFKYNYLLKLSFWCWNPTWHHCY